MLGVFEGIGDAIESSSSNEIIWTLDRLLFIGTINGKLIIVLSNDYYQRRKKEILMRYAGI